MAQFCTRSNPMKPCSCCTMKPAAERFTASIEAITWQAPQIPLVQNVSAAVVADLATLKGDLLAQLYSPVRWVETVQAFSARGIKLVLEAGPGKVLASLNRRIDKTQGALPVYDPDTLLKALDAAATYA